MSKDEIIKKLIYRSKNRGCKENDIVLGQFASNGLAQLTEEEIVVYNDLLDQYDNDIFDWITGNKRPPQHFDRLISKIRNHNKI